jgi:hypothetical protein
MAPGRLLLVINSLKMYCSAIVAYCERAMGQGGWGWGMKVPHVQGVIRFGFCKFLIAGRISFRTDNLFNHGTVKYAP